MIPRKIFTTCKVCGNPVFHALGIPWYGRKVDVLLERPDGSLVREMGYVSHRINCPDETRLIQCDIEINKLQTSLKKTRDAIFKACETIKRVCCSDTSKEAMEAVNLLDSVLDETGSKKESPK